MPKHYEIRVELLEVEPTVWRDVLIPDDMPLYEVGAIIIGAMGWNASHLFAFEIVGKRYDIRFEDGLDLEDGLDMEGVIARDVFAPGSEAAFQYDFGDDWWHLIKVKDHRTTMAGDKPPRCTGGARACPPDDSGGPYGFAEMLDAVSDPDHSDHQDMRDWLGEFDPEFFDPKEANRNLKRTLKAYLE
jgi:hypothetical protein